MSRAANAAAEENVFYIRTDVACLTVDLADSAAARELKDLLEQGDLTISMTGNSFEQYGSIGRKLTAQDTSITAQPGDVLLYNADTICVFYGTNRYRYTRLGSVRGMDSESLRELLSGKDLTMTLSLRPDTSDEQDTGNIVFEAKDGSTTVFETIDGVNYIWGLTPGMTQGSFLEDYVKYENAVIEFSGNIGTGCTVTVTAADSGIIFGTYELIIFGDIDDDGFYEGQDATIVNCLANGLLTREQVGEAKYLAADCNHDDEINSSDVLLLEQAGLLLADVDQTKNDYAETDSV